MGNIFTSIKPNVSLPKDDDEFDIREKNLETARKNYQLEQKTHMFLDVEQRSMDDVILNLPPMVSCYENINQKKYFEYVFQLFNYSKFVTTYY